MPEKNTNRKKTREHKESKGSARGSRRTYLTEQEKVLISNGGMGHSRLRGRGGYVKPIKNSGRRNDA